MTKIKAIIFDMDGVLIDAKDWHYEALNRALKLFGFEISRYEHLVTYDGLPTKTKLEMLTKAGGLPQKLHEFINELKQQYTMELIHTKCKPVFNHEYALSRLRRDGYRLALASNSIRATVEAMMERSHLIQYLDFYLSNQDVTLGKPNPEIYNCATSSLNLSPSECLVLEDNDNGKKAALDSGCWLMEVNQTGDVTYNNIIEKIKNIEAHDCG